MDDQDWEPVTVKRSARARNGSGSLSARAAHDFPNAGGSRIITARIVNSDVAQCARKLEETEIGKAKSLTPESRNEIVQKRVALGKSQVQLNQDCRFPVNTMREIESGRLCPSVQQLNVLNRVLKASLKYAS